VLGPRGDGEQCECIWPGSVCFHQPGRSTCQQSVPYPDFYKVLYDIYRGIKLCHLLQFRPFASIFLGAHVHEPSAVVNKE